MLLVHAIHCPIAFVLEGYPLTGMMEVVVVPTAAFVSALDAPKFIMVELSVMRVLNVVQNFIFELVLPRRPRLISQDCKDGLIDHN